MAARIFFFFILPVGYLAVTIASIWVPTGGTSTLLKAASATVKAVVDAADIPFKLVLWRTIMELHHGWLQRAASAV